MQLVREPVADLQDAAKVTVLVLVDESEAEGHTDLRTERAQGARVLKERINYAFSPQQDAAQKLLDVNLKKCPKEESAATIAVGARRLAQSEPIMRPFGRREF